MGTSEGPATPAEELARCDGSDEVAVAVNENQRVGKASAPPPGSIELFEKFHAQSRGLAGALGDLLKELPPTESLDHEKATVQVLLQRAVGWIHTLSKTDRVFDYQAHSSAARAMLELAVDVALITHEPKLQERMAAYEESALLKAAMKYRDFVLKAKPTEVQQITLDFIPLQGARIRALRLQHWPEFNGNHPKTWFGPAFPQVAVEADRRVGSQFEQHYAENYDRLCWGTHGSTLMLVRKNPEMLVSVSTHALTLSLRLAMDLTARAMEFFGYDAESVGDKLASRMFAAEAEHHAETLNAIAYKAEQADPHAI